MARDNSRQGLGPLILGRATARPRGRLQWYAYLSILPALCFVAVFAVYPVAFSVRLATHRYVLTDPLNHPFEGLRNVAEVLGSYYFRRAGLTTLTFTASVVASVLAFGVAVSHYLNRPGRLAGFLRVAILLPWAIPVVMAGIIWKWIFNGNYGVLNALLVSLGLIPSYVSWFGNPILAPLTLVIAHVWKWGPLAAIMCLATLQAVPRDLYESAHIDGGSGWAAFRYITLPFLRPTLLILLILETVGGFVTFDLVYVMTGGGPGDATSLLSWFAYAEIFRFLDLGKGAALAFIIAAVTLGLSLVYVRLLRLEALYS